MSDSPQRIGPYEVRGRIGAGGMGVVHLAWDPRLDRPVALKTLRPDLVRDRQARDMFISEARAVASISHPNVAQIYDIGEDAGQIYFSMEYLDGQSLKEHLEEHGRLELDAAVEMIRQAARGLKAAADRGVIHRDVKPSNLMLTADGVVRVMDFGLAHRSAASKDEAGARVVVGTPHYMAPERASGQATDLRSDVYSLGASLYELVTGRPPFVGANAISVIGKHLHQPVVAPRERNPEVPTILNMLILRMLSKRPEDRPQSYEVILRQLDRLRPDRPLTTAVAPETRGSWTGVAVAVTVITLVALGAWQLGAAHVSGPVDLSPVRTPARDAETASAAAPALQPTAPPADLRVESHTTERTEEGRMRIVGNVRNVGEGEARQGRVRVAIVDDSGAELDAAEVPLEPALVAPGEASRFEALMPGSSAGGRIKVEVTWLS